MGERIEEELRTFRHFVQVARLPVVPESIEKRYPPEPDMRCRLSHGEEVAFELVEICNPVNARFFGLCRPYLRSCHVSVPFVVAVGPQGLRRPFHQCSSLIFVQADGISFGN